MKTGLDMEIVRCALKVYSSPMTREAMRIESVIRRACQDVGFNNIAKSLEVSAPWVTGFFQGAEKCAGLSIEGIARLLEAATVEMSAGCETQMMIDSLAASALRDAAARLDTKCPLGETVTLSSEEFYQLKTLARHGASVLLGRLDDLERPAAIHQEAA